MAVWNAEHTIPSGYPVFSNASLQSIAVGFTGNLLDANLISLSLLYLGTAISSNILLSSRVTPNLPVAQYQSYKSRFARFFGDSAYQTATHLYIKKADIGLKGGINSAEAILIALLLQVQKKESNSLLSSVYIYLFSQFIETGIQPKIVFSLVVNLYFPIIYTSEPFPLLDKIMTNYSTVISPNNF